MTISEMQVKGQEAFGQNFQGIDRWNGKYVLVQFHPGLSREIKCGNGAYWSRHDPDTLKDVEWA